MSHPNPEANRLEVEIAYSPRDQFLPLHDHTERFFVCVAHRRAGKTVACINHLIRAAFECELENARFAYVAPTYGQAKDVAWEYLKRFVSDIPGATAHESELRVDLPGKGARVRLYGADNYDRLRGLYLDGVVLDEFGDMDPDAWTSVIRPALSDRRGWAIFIGTPKGSNHFAEMWDKAASREWGKLKLKASETYLLPMEELEDAKRSMSPEQYAAEYECSFDAPVVGSYYGADIEIAVNEKRVINVPHERGHQVHTAWDLGIGDSTAIWMFQTVGREVHIIDYLENHGVGLDWYAQQLASRGYVYGMHLVPHDAQARELGTGKTRLEAMQTLGLNAQVVPMHRVEDGINAARMLLPRCWFDEAKTRQGLDALKNYRREWDNKRKTFKDGALHDWASHGADAFRYLAIGIDRASVKHKEIKYQTRWIV